MLKILNFINTKLPQKQQSPYSDLRTEKPIDTLSFTTFKINSSNLAPLKSDTISFSSRKRGLGEFQKKHAFEEIDGPKKSMYDYDPLRGVIETEKSPDDKSLKKPERTISNRLAATISEEAQNDQKDLKSSLERYLRSLKPQKFGEYCNYERPVYSLEFRTKSPNSIREKASQKFLRSKEGVKNTLSDIIGARIILGDGMQGGGDKVIDRLTDAVKDGKLKIKEVESHTPLDAKYKYASDTKLRKLAEASSDRYGIFVAQKHTKNKTGYTAIHLLTEFPDGYTGEIQILGFDVAQLKELEDIPYKILQKKSFDSKYNKIAEILSPLIPADDNRKNPKTIKALKLRQEFIDYTAAAYKHEREKGPLKKRNQIVIPEFLTLSEYKSKYKKGCHLSDDMDYNNLYKIKSSADHKEQVK